MRTHLGRLPQILTAFFAVMQAATGVLLMMYYEPSARPATDARGSLLGIRAMGIVALDTASNSAGILRKQDGKPLVATPAFISSTITLSAVPYGRLIRSMHGWSASLLIATLFVWLAAGLLGKRYRTVPVPVWVLTMLLGAVVLAWGWTGAVLPWDVRGYVAAELVFGSLEQYIPWLGGLIAAVLRGSPTLGAEALTRLFTLHVVVLPLVVMVIVVTARTLATAQFSLRQSFLQLLQSPKNLILSGFASVAAMLLLVGLSTFYPDGIRATSAVLSLPADMTSVITAPAGIKPDWYFWALYALFSFVPSWLAVLLSVAVVAHVVMLPVVDAGRNLLWSRFYAIANLGIILAFLCLTAIGGWL
jgi:cytochrome b6